MADNDVRLRDLDEAPWAVRVLAHALARLQIARLFGHLFLYMFSSAEWLSCTIGILCLTTMGWCHLDAEDAHELIYESFTRSFVRAVNAVNRFPLGLGTFRFRPSEAFAPWEEYRNRPGFRPRW